MRTPCPGRRVGALSLGMWLALMAAATLGWGQAAASQPKEGETPLHITAAQLEADQEKNLIIFSGQVKAVYGDATLYADRLLVFFEPKPKGAAPAGQPKGEISPLANLGGEKIQRIEARGNVRYVQEDRVATSQEAIYYRDKNEIVLKGQPQVWRGENHLKGTKIVINLATKRVVVESSPQQRVEAHLYQTTPGGKTPRDLFPGARPAAPKGRAPR